MKQNQQREKVGGAKSGGNQAEASKTPLPVKSHRMHLIPPVTSYADVCDGFCLGCRGSAPRVLLSAMVSAWDAEAQHPGFY